MRRPLPLAPSSRQPLGKRLRTPSPPLRKQRMRQTMRQRRAGQRRRTRRRRTGGGEAPGRRGQADQAAFQKLFETAQAG